MPTFLQTTSTECGLACLGYVSAHHGRVFEMSELRSKYAVSLRGLNFAELIRLAGLMGLRARPLKLDLPALTQLTLPCILHWDMSHFVVLLKIGKTKAIIHDPSKGEKVVSMEEVSSHFTGIALELIPDHHFEPLPAKPAISWKHLVGKIDGLKRSLGQLFVLAACLQLLLLITPLFTQWIVDAAIVSADVDLLWILIIGFTLVMITRVLLEATRGWLGIVASVQFGTQWAAKVMGHLLHLPTSWFEVRHTGDIVSRFQSVQSIQQVVTGKLVDILLDGVLGLVTLIVMFFYSVKLTAVVLIAISLYAFIRVLPHGHFHKASDEALTHEAKAHTLFIENLRAIQAIKLAGLQDQRGAKWLNLNVLGTNRRLVTQKMTLMFGASYNFVFGIESIAILGWGAYAAMQGDITVGMLMAFIAYKDEFSSRMQRFIDNLMATRMLSLHTERLADIVLVDKEKTTGSYPDTTDTTDWLGSNIELIDVSFRYGESSPYVVKNLNLKIDAGSHVAIVGPTGYGKTTLAKLILGLLEPTEGKITVGGVPLNHIGLGNWRRHLGTVMQDDQLLSASLEENIAGFDDVVSIERIHEAATLAAIHEEIIAMPMGYHTLVGDMGNSLSGGQKQRVLLARALYRKPKVLILDEATSHLDVTREKEVNESINSLAITRITIAHRPETIAMADRIIDLSKINLHQQQGSPKTIP